MSIRLLLNTLKKENYAFFDPTSKLHLSLTEPLGYVGELTPSIKRGIAGGTIIDVDLVSGIIVRKYDRASHERVLARMGITRNPSADVIQEVKEEAAVAYVAEEVVSKEVKVEEMAAKEVKAEAKASTEEKKPATKKQNTKKSNKKKEEVSK